MNGRARNPTKDRRVFLSFDYDEDKHRVEVIHKSWSIRAGGAALSFVQRDISEKAQINVEEIKRLIRDRIGQTTVTCVLVGAHTWLNLWVRYEIARSVERANGLLAVRINGIADTQTQKASVAGWNPLAYLGIGKSGGGEYFLFENLNGQWMRYQDHALPIGKPPYVPDMSAGYVQPLSVGLFEYDYAQQGGAENLDEWNEIAASKVRN